MSDNTPASLACDRIASLPTHIEHYQETSDNASMVRDLLADIRHFCDQHGVDFYQQEKASYQVYLEEKAYFQ